jgi:integrase
MKLVFNPRNVARLPAPKPPADRVLHWDAADTAPPMFGVRCTANGERAYVIGFRLNGRSRLLTLGKVEGMTLAGARKAARAALDKAGAGEDPLAAKKRAGANTVATLADDFIRSPEVQRLKTRADYERTVKREIVPAFGTMKPAELGRTELRAWADAIHKRAPYAANAALAVVRRMLRWAVEHDRLETLPVFPKPPEPPKSRERVLTEDELRAAWAGMAREEQRGNIVGSALKLMLLTAQRRGEVMRMRWADVSGSWWTITDNKAGRTHRVPLSQPALDVLDRVRERTGKGEYVFPGRKGGPLMPHHAAGRLWADTAVKDARVHDLRRSAASFMGSLGVSRFVIARVLNHADRSVTAVYDRHSYDAEKMVALERWAEDLTRILAGKERERGNVAQFQLRSA